MTRRTRRREVQKLRRARRAARRKEKRAAFEAVVLAIAKSSRNAELELDVLAWMTKAARG